MLAATAPTPSAAQVAWHGAVPLKDRNIDVSREEATERPRSEEDQALVGGWPLYRTKRGQEAFNDAMATLKATDAAAPAAKAFKGCAELECNLSLPALTADGWIPPGRLWVSPGEYALFVHSPRLGEGQAYRRRARRDMKYFVFHEFHNSTRNTDTYDTISSHSGSVFVPFYMSKQGIDAKGRRFVIVVQVAPYDVVSIHASNWGSAGAGIEVAKNMSDALEPLQALAGILVATILETAAPHLRVVNHAGSEGLPMLNGYERRLATLRARRDAPARCSAVRTRSSPACGCGNRQAGGADRAWRCIGAHSHRRARDRAADAYPGRNPGANAHRAPKAGGKATASPRANPHRADQGSDKAGTSARRQREPMSPSRFAVSHPRHSPRQRHCRHQHRRRQ